MDFACSPSITATFGTKMTEKRTFRLPDRTYTSSVKKFTKAWQDLYEPLEKLFDAKCYGFDPDLAFVSKTQSSFALPVWVAQKIVASLEKKDA